MISYEKGDLEEAAALLLADYDKLKDSAGYQYDLANVLQQVLSNSAQEYQKGMSAAFSAKDLESFKTYSDKFMSVIEDMEKVTGTSEYFLLGRWVEQAKALAKMQMILQKNCMSSMQKRSLLHGDRKTRLKKVV